MVSLESFGSIDNPMRDIQNLLLLSVCVSLLREL